MILRRVAEPLAFLSLATAVHAAVWVGLPGAGAGGAASEGGGGGAAVTLAGGPALSRLAAEWSRPPETPAEAPRAPAPQEAEEVAPALPQAEAAAPRSPVPDMALAMAADRLPALDTEPPPAPVMAAEAPPSATRPKARPEPAPARKAAESKPVAEAAAGIGTAPQAGRAGAVAAAPGTGRAGEGALSEGRRNSLMADWAGQIRARVERRKSYPRAAQVQGLTGTVTLRLTVAPDGRLLGFDIAESSGHALLDEAALSALSRAGKFPPAPEGLGGKSHAFSLPVTFAR